MWSELRIATGFTILRPGANRVLAKIAILIRSLPCCLVRSANHIKGRFDMARTDPRNTTQYWWDRHTRGLSLMRADFTTHEYPPHTHQAFVVAVTEEGGSIIQSRGQIEQAHRSVLFVFNPAEPHAGWMGWSERWKYRSMYLTRQALDEVAHDLGIESVPYFTRNTFSNSDLIEAFGSMHLAIEEGQDVFRER